MKYLFLFAAFCLATTTMAQPTLKVRGEIRGLADGTPVYIGPISNAKADSTVSKGGKFRFDLSVPEGDIYLIQAGKNRQDENSGLLLYLQSGRITIKGSGPLLKDVKLSGSSFVKDYNDFQNRMQANAVIKGATAIYKQYNEAYREKDSATMTALKPELEKIDSVRTALSQQWFDAHAQSPLSSFVLYWYLRRGRSMEELEDLLGALAPGAKDNALARKMQNSIETSKATAIGKTAPDFVQNDTLGKPVSLKDFRGKYVLVDFWASWCVPCRAENPNVVAAFNKYKDKNFTVLGVSLDQPNGKEKWLKAIHDDQLTWTHVSDLKFWDNAVARQYDVNSIPANLLIDPEGRIVAKSLRGEELEKKLEELLQ